MQKAKASTMRMVAFTELGVDCVYTIEASLAGKFPYHFGAGDLINLGRDLCSGLLTVYPSLAARSSPLYEVPVLISNSNSAAALSMFTHEMNLWKQLYSMETASGSGASLLSESALSEVTANDDGGAGGGDDSDKESVEPPPAPGGDTGKSGGGSVGGKKKASGSSKASKSIANKDKEDGSGKPWKSKRSTKATKQLSLGVNESSWAFDGTGIAFATPSSSQKKLESKMLGTPVPPATTARGNSLICIQDNLFCVVGSKSMAPPTGGDDPPLSSQQHCASAMSRSTPSAKPAEFLLQGTGQYRTSSPSTTTSSSSSAAAAAKQSDGLQLQLRAVQALISSPVSAKAGNKLKGQQRDASPLPAGIPAAAASSPLPMRITATIRPSTAIPASASTPERSGGVTVDYVASFLPPKKSPPSSPETKRFMSSADSPLSAANPEPPQMSPSSRAALKDLRKKGRTGNVDSLGANGLPMNGNIIISSPTPHSPPTLDDTDITTAARFAVASKLRGGGTR